MKKKLTKRSQRNQQQNNQYQLQLTQEEIENGKTWKINLGTIKIKTEIILFLQMDEIFFSIPSRMFVWNVIGETTDLLYGSEDKSFQLNHPIIELHLKSLSSSSFNYENNSIETKTITIQLRKRKLTKFEDLPFYIELSYQSIESPLSIRRNDPDLSIDYSKPLIENSNVIIYQGTFKNENVIIRTYKSIKYEKEISFLKQFIHPNIVQLIASFFGNDGKTFGIFMLPTFTLNECYLKYSFEFHIQIIQNIIQALQYLHQMHFVHLNICLESIVIYEQDNTFEIRLSSLYHMIEENETIDQQKRKEIIENNGFYCAPELYSNEKITSSCDIFSLGKVMYILLNRIEIETIENENKRLKQCIDQNEEYHYEFVQYENELLQNCISQCCDNQPWVNST